MNEVVVSYENYITILNNFLDNIRKDIEKYDSLKTVYNDLTDLDNYIHEINTYYYKSFHNEFFPLYKSEIENEISNLYRISRQEDMIKKDILSNIKRYAKLYNQVKSINSLLANSRTEVNGQLVKVIREQDKRSIELIYALKKLEESLKELCTILKEIKNFHKDKELLTILNKFPAHVSAVKLFNVIDVTDSKQTESVHKLLINLNYNIKLLVKVQLLKDDYQNNATEIINELRENTLDFLKEKAPVSLRLFYENHLKNQFLMYLELISLHIENNNYQRVNKMAQEFEDWLISFVLLIEKTMVYASNGKKFLLENISQIIQLDFTVITNLETECSKTLEIVETLISYLSGSSEPDITFFTKNIIDLLNEANNYFNNISIDPVIKACGIISSSIYRVNMELSLLEMKVNLLHEKFSHSKNVSDQFLSILNMLNTYLSLLSNIRADLERLLAPRNIARTWKDINIRVERIAIEKGKIFPSEFTYILDKAKVETRISYSDDNMTVLHEEGDIFIIKVDDLLEEEVPYTIISMRG